VAHWAILVQDEPVLDAKLAVELIAVVALLGVSTHF